MGVRNMHEVPPLRVTVLRDLISMNLKVCKYKGVLYVKSLAC